MYVKKFEGESLDEALQAVKRELGPDAIILKTVSNKGLKGAFKKSRIEITAAISEQNYEKKARVDHVLNDEQRDDFYNSSAGRINNMINEYDEHRPRQGGYGNMGLNRVVKTVSKASNRIKNSLDDFLAMDDEHENSDVEERLPHSKSVAQEREEVEEQIQHMNIEANPYRQIQSDISSEVKEQLKNQKHQIELLEQKLYDLSLKMSEKNTHEKEDPTGILSLRTILKSLELSEQIVQGVVKKAMFELDRDALNDADVLYEFALREINELIQIGMPLFSSTDIQKSPVLTVLISENSCGQSSMAMKLAVLHDNVKVIRLRENEAEVGNHDFTAKMFDLKMQTVRNLSQLISEARKTVGEGKSIILDLRLSFKDNNETKKFLEMLKRSFENVEILINVSGIHSELYNRKIVTKYKNFADGLVVSFLDQCLSFGSLVNVHVESGYLPFKFFGTGALVPDDIEAATAERLLAGMFQF